MQIFFSGCKSASDMAFLLVHIQHQPDLLCQSGIDLYQAVSTVLMCRTLTDPELLRRLPHCCPGLNDIFRNFHCTFLDIIFQG